MDTERPPGFAVGTSVRIVTHSLDDAEIDGRTGVVTSITQSHQGKYAYSVRIAGSSLCMLFDEEELQADVSLSDPATWDVAADS